MKKVFILNGSGGVGKDTFVRFCCKYALVMHESSVYEVKKIAKFAGWNGGKTEKDRKFLSDLKDLLIAYNDRPFDYMRRCIKVFEDSFCEILFIDVREPAEIDRAKREFNAETILVVNNRVEPIASNHADSCVYNYEYDYTIYNNSTIEDLDRAAKEFIASIRKHSN